MIVRVLLVVALVGGGSATALARENLNTERMLQEVLMSDGEEDEAGSRWAILPQVGFSPEKGPNGGLKYTHRDLTSERLTVDFNGIYAAEGQIQAKFRLVAPELLGDWVIGMLEVDYLDDPGKEFFGLGNNEVGPDELSTHGYRTAQGLLTLAVRPFPRLTVAGTFGHSDVRVDRGELEGDVPSTVDLFPELNGLGRTRANPVSFSIVYNNRVDVTRPTRGWSLAAKIQHVSRELGGDNRFTRYILDASYLLPLVTRRQVFGLRVGGEFIDAERRAAPFFELASLGGADDLRGYFEDRFLGRSRVMINAEYRLMLVEFDFRDWWRVRIDGVAFGDMGRVFIGESDLRSEFEVDQDLVPRLFRDFRYSYGGGLRFALGEVVVARLDAGFSDEETGLIYLTFGHTF